MSILSAFASLGRDINKTHGKDNPESEQGIVSEKFPELKLEMENEKLIALTTKWENSWKGSNVFSEWEKKGDDNERYWKGEHYSKPDASKTRSMVDNAIFESLETYLPQATRRNPESMLELRTGEEENEQNEKFVHDLQDYIGVLADELKIRLKLKKAARHWSIYLLGAAKMGWDIDNDIPTTKIIRAKKLILDPTATIDEDGYTGEFVGEYRKLPASKLISMLENMDAEADAITKINELVEENKGTEIQFIEWWTQEYMCWTLDKTVLVKLKNPHWNYDTENIVPATNDEYGVEIPESTQVVPGFNHFSVPKMPYVFLSVFNLGKQPVDDTSLIGQNLANQDRINKRVRQIDRNADSMNGGMVVSLERSGLTQSQAGGVTQALANGGVVVIPTGAPQDAVYRSSAPSLPADVYNDLNDTRMRLQDVFGTRGSNAAGISNETTVRGKLINRGLDTDRIGGGVSEYLEQFADEIYNWMVQLLYVYDDVYAQFPNKPRITVSVKEGSLLPKDSTTIANQAIELANAGKMSTLDLYKRLDYPNPEELAANAWLEANAPELLYANDPRVAQVMQSRSAAQEKPPSTSISYKDLPPEGQSQLAGQAGIRLAPQAIAQADAEKKRSEALMKGALPSESQTGKAPVPTT